MKLVFATHNTHKFEEVRLIMPKHIELLSLSDIGCTEDIAETGKSLKENALIKASYVYQQYQVACFSDDTGLEVEALNGAPGVFSARYAGAQKNSDANMNKLLEDLKMHTNRSAQFRTVIALKCLEKEIVFEGVVEGIITQNKNGNGGFGYDPIFQPEGYLETFGVLPEHIKNSISHRALAINKLINFLQQEN